MNDRAKEAADFDARSAAISQRFGDRGVTIVKKAHLAEAVGRWYLVGGDEKRRIDFSYDGKDSYLQYRDAAFTLKDCRDRQHKRFETWKGEYPIAFLEEVLARQSNFPQRFLKIGISGFNNHIPR